jgi:hypothetical protein
MLDKDKTFLIFSLPLDIKPWTRIILCRLSPITIGHVYPRQGYPYEYDYDKVTHLGDVCHTLHMGLVEKNYKV